MSFIDFFTLILNKTSFIKDIQNLKRHTNSKNRNIRSNIFQNGSKVTINNSGFWRDYWSINIFIIFDRMYISSTHHYKSIKLRTYPGKFPMISNWNWIELNIFLSKKLDNIFRSDLGHLSLLWFIFMGRNSFIKKYSNS